VPVDETSRSDTPVTEKAPAESEQTEESTEPSEGDEQEAEGALPEGTKNWQHAIQQAREREKAAVKRARKVEKQLRDQSLDKMSDADKFKTIAAEETEKRAKLELQLIVDRELHKYSLPTPVEKLLRDKPWMIPGVEEDIGPEPTWDDTITAVRKHLPTYLTELKGSLAPGPKKAGEPEEEVATAPEGRVDTERSATSGEVTRRKNYSRQEIAALARDPEKWEKVREKVLADLQRRGGVIPQ
jgi:hypothetical protein